jgi:beta-mannosidase
MVGEPEDWRCRVVAGNDTLQDAEGDFRITDADTGTLMLQGHYRAPANANVAIGSLPVSHSEHRLFLIRWTADGRAWGSHYLLGTPPFSLARYREWLPAIAALPGSFDASTVGT